MAGIIKSGRLEDGPNVPQVAAFNFEDMSRKADTYLDTVRRQAAQILVQAKEQAAIIEKQARQQGRQEAVREAEQVARTHVEQRMQTLFPALEKAIESIQLAREAWLKEWERRTVGLATAIASRVIRRELNKAPEITSDLICETLELVTGQGQLSVHLHPQDCETLGERAQLLIKRLANVGGCTVVPDPGIEPGGCRVDTEFGCVDQQISTQLKRIEEELGE